MTLERNILVLRSAKRMETINKNIKNEDVEMKHKKVYKQGRDEIKVKVNIEDQAHTQNF